MAGSMKWAAARPNARGNNDAHSHPFPSALASDAQHFLPPWLCTAAASSHGLGGKNAKLSTAAIWSAGLYKFLKLYNTLKTKSLRLLTCSMMPMSSAACDSCTPVMRLTLKEYRRHAAPKPKQK